MAERLLAWDVCEPQYSPVVIGVARSGSRVLSNDEFQTVVVAVDALAEQACFSGYDVPDRLVTLETPSRTFLFEEFGQCIPGVDNDGVQPVDGLSNLYYQLRQLSPP